jgi:hypothetical protein
MRSGTAIGTGAGFVGGLVAALVLSILGIKGHEGEMARAISLVSHAVGSDRQLVGDLVMIAVSTALGALFGRFYTSAGLRRESAAVWASAYGLAWWIVGWFAVMPPPLRFAPWEALEDPALCQLAVAGLLACLGFGAAIAVAFTIFGRPEASSGLEPIDAARSVTPPDGALSLGKR